MLFSQDGMDGLQKVFSVFRRAEGGLRSCYQFVTADSCRQERISGTQASASISRDPHLQHS